MPIPDFSNRYNTSLTPEEEAAYSAWAESTGRSRDVFDYDLRGAWKELQSGRMTEDSRGHLGDKYKKPNHPTFSNESIYNGVDGFVGGKWSNNNGKIVYTPNEASNAYSFEELQDYFSKYEPNATLQRQGLAEFVNKAVLRNILDGLAFANSGNGFVIPATSINH